MNKLESYSYFWYDILGWSPSGRTNATQKVPFDEPIPKYTRLHCQKEPKSKSDCKHYRSLQKQVQNLTRCGKTYSKNWHVVSFFLFENWAFEDLSFKVSVSTCFSRFNWITFLLPKLEPFLVLSRSARHSLVKFYSTQVQAKIAINVNYLFNWEGIAS